MTNTANPILIMNTTEERLAWALAALVRADIRLTPVRQGVLAQLAARRLPVALEMLSRLPDLRDRFDDTTLYRTLMFYVDLELVRQIHLQDRLSYFVLNAPGERFNYLVCRCCGALKLLPPLEEAHLLERQVAETHDYAGLQHEVLVSGICPECKKSPETCMHPTKLTPRGRRCRRHTGSSPTGET